MNFRIINSFKQIGFIRNSHLWLRRSLTICGICCILGAHLAISKARPHDCSQLDKTTVNLPISLAVGTVRTPAFAVKHKDYLIEIRAQWLLPTEDLKCKMGFNVFPSLNKCKESPVIGADWTVTDGEREIAHGAAMGKSDDFEGGACYLGRFLGEFEGKSGHRYVLTVRFTKDGKALDVTHPRLVVVMNTENAF